MVNKTYADKLKDPRWQKLRLKIMERDEWRCQACFNDKETLHVHHMVYMGKNEPWEAPELSLATVCESCHDILHSKDEDQKCLVFTKIWFVLFLRVEIDKEKEGAVG